MKKHKLIIFITAILFILATGAAAAELPKLLYTDYSVSYASILTPSQLENNDTGLYDTAGFSAKIGVDILKWADVYAGASFELYPGRNDLSEHFSFIPLYAGARVNIFPEWCVFPGIFVEGGMAYANVHYGVNVYVPPPTNVTYTAYFDTPWAAGYFNFGFDINLNVADIAVLALRFERPTISNMDKSHGELHMIKTGLAWKVLY